MPMRRESNRERKEQFQSFTRPKVKVTRTSKAGKVYVDYKDTESLRKLVSGNGKILSRKRTGANAMEQRMILLPAPSSACYMAALLPYVILGGLSEIANRKKRWLPGSFAIPGEFLLRRRRNKGDGPAYRRRQDCPPFCHADLPRREFSNSLSGRRMSPRARQWPPAADRSSQAFGDRVGLGRAKRWSYVRLRGIAIGDRRLNLQEPAGNKGVEIVGYRSALTRKPPAFPTSYATA